MAVGTNENVKYQAAGNGSNTTFATLLVAGGASEIGVWITTAAGAVTAQVAGVDYTFSNLGGTATIVFQTAPPAGSTVTFLRKTAIAQALDLTYNERLPSIQIEAQLDALVRMIRDLDARATIAFPGAEPAGNPTTLSAPAQRKGKLLAFNNNTGAMEELPKEELLSEVLGDAQADLEAAVSAAGNSASAASASASAASASAGAASASAGAASASAGAASNSASAASASASAAAASAVLADVNNTSVNTAISTDPAATRAAAGALSSADLAGVIENPSGLLPMFDACMAFDQDSTVFAEPPVRAIVGFGDSMVAPYAGALVEELQRVYGVGAWLTANIGAPSANGTSGAMTLAGGASVPNPSFTLTPGTNWINMPAGSSATHTLARTTEAITKPTGATTGITGQKINTWHGFRPLPGGCRKVAVLIATAPGAGTLDITVAQDQYSNLTAIVNTDDSAGFIAQEFVPVDRHAPITVTVQASVATCTIMGVIYFSGDGGIIYWDAAEGGSTMESQLASLSGGAFKPAFAGLFAYINTRMVFHHQRAANDPNSMANYDLFFDAFDALATGDGKGITQFVMGELPLRTEGVINIATHNANLRLKAKTRRYPYLDGQNLLASHAQIASAGWTNGSVSDVHFYGPTPRFVAGWIAHQCNHFRSALSIHQPGYSKIASIRERFNADMIEEVITDRIILRPGISLASPVLSGAGYAIETNSTRGLLVTGGTAIGHAKQEIGALGWGGAATTPALNVHQLNHAISINGLQSLSLVALQRAWIAIGLRSGNTHTSVATIANRSFGLEMAIGDDVGNPDGSTGANRHAARLWMHDGTSIVYSRWFGLGVTGDASTATGGTSIILDWEQPKNTLHGYVTVPSGTPSNRAIRPMASITSSAFGSASTHGAFLFAGIGADSAPASTGFIAIKNITLKAGNIGYPHRRIT